MVRADGREDPAGRTSVAAVLGLINLGVKTLSNAVALSLVIRFLGRDEAGLWAILQGISMYLGLTELGLGQTVMNIVGALFARRERQRIEETLSTALILYIYIVTPVLLIVVIGGALLPIDRIFLKSVQPDAPGSLRVLFLVTATLTLVRIPLTVFPSALLGLRELAARQWYELTLALATLLATVGVLLARGNLLALLVTTNTVSFAVMAAVYPALIRGRGFDVKVSFSRVRRELLLPFLTNSGLFFVIGLAFIVDRSAGSILIGKFGTLGQVPVVFAMLTLFRTLGWSVVNIISSILLPYMIMYNAREQADRVTFFALLCTKTSVLVASALTLVVWLFAKPLFALWLGKGYEPDLTALVLLGLAFMVDSVFMTSTNFLVGLNRHRRLARAMAFKTVAVISLGFLGAVLFVQQPVTGIIGGIAIGSVISQSLQMPAIVRRDLGLTSSQFRDQFLVRPSVVVAVPGLALGATGFLGTSGGASLVAVALSAMALLLVIQWRVIYDASEREWLGSLFRRCASSVIVRVRRLPSST